MYRIVTRPVVRQKVHIVRGSHAKTDSRKTSRSQRHHRIPASFYICSLVFCGVAAVVDCEHVVFTSVSAPERRLNPSLSNRMFSTRFLRGGLKTSVVHVYCTDSKGTRDFRFHWLENEDSEDIAQRFEAQLNQELVEWGREAPGSGDVPAAAVLPAPIPANARVPVSTSLQIEKTSNDSADHEVLLHILGILRVHELHELLFKEQCKYLDRTTGADQLDTLTVLDLTSCGLTEVPASICNLHNLKTFVMSKNKLTSLPHFIGTLQQLVNLNADDNTLTSLPGMVSKPDPSPALFPSLYNFCPSDRMHDNTSRRHPQTQPDCSRTPKPLHLVPQHRTWSKHLATPSISISAGAATHLPRL